MAITQPSLITWQAVESSADIERLRAVLEHLHDESLVLAFEQERGGRNDKYPVRAVWNAILAGIVLCHWSTAALLRELCRNAELREVCGFDPMLGADAVPSPFAMSRFLRKLLDYQEEVLAIFARLLEEAATAFPDFGKHLAIDGKAIHSVNRSDSQAGAGKKTTDEEGKTVTFSWFGFKLHLLADVTTELPIAFDVTPANVSEAPKLEPLVNAAYARHGFLSERAETLAADKGYDSGEIKKVLYNDFGLLPIVPARDCSKKEDYKRLDPGKPDTIYISPTGQICCQVDPAASEREKQFCPMQFHGYEKDRGTLKFRCPAAAQGVECKNAHNCKSAAKNQNYGRVVRVKPERDPRLITPCPQGTQGFSDLYAGRTAVERLFSRLDHLYGIEAPQRGKGLVRAKLRVTMALCAMLATALAWAKEGHEHMARSRLQSPLRKAA